MINQPTSAVVNLRLMIYFKVAKNEPKRIILPNTLYERSYLKKLELQLFCIKLSDDRILSLIIQLQLLDKK